MRLFDRKFGAGFLARVPAAPGVYRIFDNAGVLIYVGKAGDLRRRLGQYRATIKRKTDRKRGALVRAAARITWEVCESPLAAALTEIRLIQSLRPRRNVTSAFPFLYPFVGVHEDGPETYFCLTTAPVAFPAFAFHGAYRSRLVTREALYALGRLLRFVGHPVPSHRCRRLGTARRALVLGFRRLPQGAAAGWHAFLRGESREALESLAVALLEHPAATARRAEIQEDLHAVALFFDVEAGPLARARAATGYAAYPVPQAERDLLFTELREAAVARARSALAQQRMTCTRYACAGGGAGATQGRAKVKRSVTVPERRAWDTNTSRSGAPGAAPGARSTPRSTRTTVSASAPATLQP